MRIRSGRGLAVVVGMLVGLLGVAGVESQAHAASTSTVVTSTLPTPIPTGSQQDPITTLPPQALVAGTNRYFHASYNATGHFGSASDKILQAAQIWCMNGTTKYASPFSTTNRYVAGPTGSIQVYWLFQVPVDGTYTCSLMGWAASTGNFTTDSLTINPGGGTYLYLDDHPLDGSSWRESSSSVEITPGTYQYVLRQTWPATAPRKAPSPSFTVTTGVQLTNHYAALTDNTDVTVQLGVIQGGDTYCHTIQRTTGPFTITSYIHHQKVYISAVVPVDPACPNQWAIKTKVVNGAGGAPLTVNDTGYSETFATWN